MSAVPVDRVLNNLTKESVYGWGSVPVAHERLMIPKAMLLLDRSYQRQPIEAKVLSIARSYDARLAGTITVARRDGRFYVIDGGHRVAAAMRRSSVDLMDCLVIDSTGPQMEAELFVKCNTMRKPVTAIEKFNAKVMYGDPVATTVAKLVEQSGRKVDRNQSHLHIGCIGKVEEYVRQHGEAFVELWPLIVELMQGEVFDQQLMRAITGLHLRLRTKDAADAKQPGLLRWRERVLNAGYAKLFAEVKRAYAMGARTDRQWGEFIATTLDYRCRKPNLIRDILDASAKG